MMEAMRVRPRKISIMKGAVFFALLVIAMALKQVAAVKRSTTFRSTTSRLDDVHQRGPDRRRLKKEKKPKEYEAWDDEYEWDDDHEDHYDEDDDYWEDENDALALSPSSMPSELPSPALVTVTAPPTSAPTTSVIVDENPNDKEDEQVAQLTSLSLLPFAISVTSLSSSSSTEDSSSSTTDKSILALEEAMTILLFNGLSMAFGDNVVRVDLTGEVLEEQPPPQRERKRTRGLLRTLPSAPFLLEGQEEIVVIPEHQQERRQMIFTTEKQQTTNGPVLFASAAQAGSSTTGTSSSSTTATTLDMAFMGDVIFESTNPDDVPSQSTLHSAQHALLSNPQALEKELQAALDDNTEGSASGSDTAVIQVNYVQVSEAGDTTTPIKDEAGQEGGDESPSSAERSVDLDKNSIAMVAVVLTASSMLLVGAALLMFQRKRRLEANGQAVAILSCESGDSSASVSSSSLSYPTPLYSCSRKQHKERKHDKEYREYRDASSPASKKTKTKKTKSSKQDASNKNSKNANVIPIDICVSTSGRSSARMDNSDSDSQTGLLPPNTASSTSNNGTGAGAVRQSRSTRRSSRRHRRKGSRGSSIGSCRSLSSAGNVSLTRVVEEEYEEVYVEAHEDDESLERYVELYAAPQPKDDRPEEPSGATAAATDTGGTSNLNKTIQAMAAAAAAGAAAHRSASPTKQRSSPRLSVVSRETDPDTDEATSPSDGSGGGGITPKLTAMWGERVRSEVEPSHIYPLANNLTQSQNKANNKNMARATSPPPSFDQICGSTSSGNSKSPWHSPQTNRHSSQVPPEEPTSPYDEQQTDLCDPCIVSGCPSPPTIADNDDPMLARVNSLFTSYSTATVNAANNSAPTKIEDDGNATDHSGSSCSSTGDALVNSIFKARYFSKEQASQAEGIATAPSSDASTGGAVSPPIEAISPARSSVLIKPLDSYYLESNALVDDASDDGSAALEEALLYPAKFLEKSTGHVVSNKQRSVESKNGGSSSSSSMPTDEELSYKSGESSKGSNLVSPPRMMTSPPVMGTTRPSPLTAGSAKRLAKQQLQSSSKPSLGFNSSSAGKKKKVFPGYSRIRIGAGSGGGGGGSPTTTGTPSSGMETRMVYPDEVVL